MSEKQRNVQMNLFKEQAAPKENNCPEVYALFLQDLETRYEIGLQRYGKALQPFNNRDALRDAYEEAIDLAFYLRQAIYERACV